MENKPQEALAAIGIALFSVPYSLDPNPRILYFVLLQSLRGGGRTRNLKT